MRRSAGPIWPRTPACCRASTSSSTASRPSRPRSAAQGRPACRSRRHAAAGSGRQPEPALVLDLAVVGEALERDDVAAAARLDDDAPRLLVDAQLRARMAPAQARDRARLVDGELAVHVRIIGNAPEDLMNRT